MATMKHFTAGISMALVLSGCQSMNDVASKAAEGMQAAFQGAHEFNETLKASNTHSVRGRVTLRDGQTLTCFNGIQTGYLGPRNMTSPGQGNYDPRTGTVTLSTAAIPLVVMTKTGTVISNDCDKLAAEGVLEGSLASGSVGNARDRAKPTNSQSFARTELPGLFEKYPQPGGGKSTTWPRVAITLLEEPSWGVDKLSQSNNFRPPAFGCWKFKARIWESEKVSRAIPTFHYCTDEGLTIPGGDNAMIYQVWSGIVTPQEKLGSTGIRRTEGPNFPDTPLPVAKRSNQTRLNPVTFTGQTIAGVLYATGIDMNKLQDPRLWLNFSAELEAR